MRAIEATRFGILSLAILGLVFAGCPGISGGGGGGGADGDPLTALNSGILLPGQGEVLDNPATDEGIDVGGETGGIMPLYPGGTVTVTIPFFAPDANVVGAGIRFGDSGPVQVVPIDGAIGVSEGTLTFDFQVPDNICDNLSSICHDIRCYEFAVTDAGMVSAANINQVALACAGCDEPSCQSLLTDCEGEGECTSPDDCASDETCVDGNCVGQGDLRFTMRWSAETDVDLHVMTPTGTEIYYSNTSADGGTLDHDDTSGGSGSVENVFFVDPLPGTYEFWAFNYGGSSAAVPYSIEAATPNQTLLSESESLPADSVDGTHYTISYSP